MKPEDRKRLKQHIDLIVEHKEPEDEIADLREKNIKLRLELSTLRFKESQENRFIWWIYNVYSRNVCDLIYVIMGATTYDTEGEAKEGKYALPKECFDLMKRIDEYTEHVYDGTYLDVEMSTEPSKSDVSITEDVSIDSKMPNSIETVEEKEIATLRAENERLREVERKAIEQSQDVQHNWLSPIETIALRKELTTLRELVGEYERISGDLARFGWHAVGCVKRSPHAAVNDICDCGWIDAAREHRALIKKAQEVGK